MSLLPGFLSAQTIDLEVYNRLVRENQDSVYTLAYILVGSRIAAENAVQSAFIQAYQRLGRRNFASYHLLVYRALVNAIQQELKGAKKSFPNIEHPVDEVGGAVWSSLQRLPPDLRLVAALVDVAGLDYEQASEVLSVKVNEIRRRLALARSLLGRQSS